MGTEQPQTPNEAAGGASDVERVVRLHKALSARSLAAVWEWAEANEGNALAEAYMGACSAVGMLDCSAICDVLEKDWRGKKYGYIHEAYKPYSLAFIYRDTVGRLILDMLRRQKPKLGELRKSKTHNVEHNRRPQGVRVDGPVGPREEE